MNTRFTAVVAAASLALCVSALAQAPTSQPALPERTSRYNVGNAPGRHRGPDGKIKRFALEDETPLYDGGGREFGRVKDPVLLNVGAGKRMDLDGKPGLEEYVWAWKTEAGSGWINRSAIVDPPPFAIDQTRSPKPPREADKPLTINAARGTELLKDLRHTNSQGVIPTEGGNKGEHYAGRNPGPLDFVYILFACPNVQRGARRAIRSPTAGGSSPRWTKTASRSPRP
ncbi:MAG TPA: hypothetical protein VGR35_10600 [Tepidisphaeraceae bacterium]|nr:hypothetical protein [Tepidisphaeraceae bacterium]